MFDLNSLIISINNFLWGWPLIAFIVGAALFITASLRFVQFRYFLTAWKMVLFPDKAVAVSGSDMSPFQAFMNALSASIGNGSLAGMATAVYAGGPGAGFWVFMFGLFGMALRYSEVYLSALYGSKNTIGGIFGGPMVYLEKIPGGSYLPYIYALFCFFLALASGNAMQANSICLGCVRIFAISPMIVAVILLAFITYVMTGGAKRIVTVSEKIVPIKVGVFFVSAIIVLIYHWRAIVPALQLIVKGAFTPIAFGAGAAGYAIQSAMRYGLVRSANASEAGLGTAAVLFGGSTSKDPVRDGIMGMLSSFISANLVCFSTIVMIVASGVWNNGQTSLDLTISAYETVFGNFGGWIVTFLSASFGLGVLVAYAYISRACWMFLTGGRLMNLFTVIFCAVTFLGALAQVDIVWNAVDLANAGLLLMNLYGLVMLISVIKNGLVTYQARHKGA